MQLDIIVISFTNKTYNISLLFYWLNKSTIIMHSNMGEDLMNTYDA